MTNLEKAKFAAKVLSRLEYRGFASWNVEVKQESVISFSASSEQEFSEPEVIWVSPNSSQTGLFSPVFRHPVYEPEDAHLIALQLLVQHPEGEAIANESKY